MKRTIFGASILAVLAFTIISCDDDKVVSDTQLPDASKVFLSAYFNGVDIIRVEKEGTNYSVNLANKVEVDFSSSGEWLEVDGDNGVIIPVGFINPKIVDYVANNYPDNSFNGIEKNINGYDVDLIQGNIDLFFDLEGNFVRLDP